MNTPIRFQRFRIRRGGLIALGLSLALVIPALSSAGEIRLKPYNRGQGLQSPVRTPSQHDTSQPTRLSGTFEYSLRSGLTLQGQTVQVTARTAVFPSIKGSSMMPDPSDLQGHYGTVYGQPGPNGVEAVLLILNRDSRYGVTTDGPDLQQFQLEGGSMAPLELGDEVPQ